MLRVAHYLNQFFAGIGGEEQANVPPERRDTPVGPGRAIQNLIKSGGGMVVSSLVCGDNFFNEQADVAHAAVRAWLEEVYPDLVVAGPAFAAGRYGSACASVCRLADELGIPAVTGMHPENPGTLMYRQAYIVPTGGSAADMGPALTGMVSLGRKLASGVPLGPAELEGYLPRGVRRPGMRDRSGAVRALEMLVAKCHGHPFRTEVPVERYDSVSPAPPIRDLRGATIAAVTTGAIVPKGNPDRVKRANETRWLKYALNGREILTPDDFECVHGGFFNTPASKNPNVVLPLDVLRDLEREGTFAKLLDFYCTTTGNDQRVVDCKRNGAEIGAALKTQGVSGVLLVAT